MSIGIHKISSKVSKRNLKLDSWFRPGLFETYLSNTGSLAAKAEDFFSHFEWQNFFWQMFKRESHFC